MEEAYLKYIWKKALSLLLFCWLLSHFSLAQYKEDYPDTLNKAKLRKAILTESVSYAAGLSFLHFIWYKDTPRVPFHYYDDSKGYLQIDKAGHAFTAYRESYAFYHGLRKAGVNKKKALLYGGSMGLIFQTPIEIFDGMYEGWGFSWSDMAANTFGSALFIGQELLFDEQLILMKFSYAPSPYAAYYPPLGENPIQQFFYDYNGHTYWLSANMNSTFGTDIFPDWLNFACGYGANGMLREFDNPSYYRGEALPDFTRNRQFLFSLDVDFTRIPTDKKWLKTVFRGLNMVKVPFPAFEYSSENGLQFKPFYF